MAAQPAYDPGHLVVGLRGGRRLARDDQRRARLVDQDRVDLVDDRVVVAALGGVLERDRHVVAQIVEAELGVRPVGDVGLVGELAALRVDHRLDEGDGHAEPLEDAAVPLGVALGEVVVDRDQVHPLAEHAPVVGGRRRQRVQVEREARDERLSLTGLHLGDVALVQDDPAHHLDVEDALIRLADARLANGRERLEQQLVERLAVVEPLPELGGLGTKLGVGKPLELGLERRDVRRLLLQALQALALAEAEEPLESVVPGHGHRVSALPGLTPPRARAAQSWSISTSQASPAIRRARTTLLGALERRDRAEAPFAVDQQRPLALVARKLDLLAAHLRQPDDRRSGARRPPRPSPSRRTASAR